MEQKRSIGIIQGSKLSYFLFFLFFLFSCNKEDKKQADKLDSKMNAEIVKLREKLIETKDDYYLLHLFNNEINSGGSISNILPEAFFISSFKESPFAYTVIYRGILELNFKKANITNKEYIYFEKLPITDKKIILNYLNKGAEIKDAACVSYLIDIYKYQRQYEKVKYYKSIKDLKYKFWE